jgi:hypothetical protein
MLKKTSVERMDSAEVKPWANQVPFGSRWDLSILFKRHPSEIASPLYAKNGHYDGRDLG